MAMKKFITPILVTIIMVMSGYIIFDKYQSSKDSARNNEQKISQNISSVEKQSENLFAKKKECAGYKDKIMEDIMMPNLVYHDSDPELTKIFYSPKRNSCLYIFDYYKYPDCLNMDTDTYVKVGCQFKESQIVDFLTKEIVYSSATYNICFEHLTDKENADITACKTVSEKAEELSE